MITESQIIGMLRGSFPASQGCLGIGDDAAILPNGLMVSTDACVEGVHFLRNKATWAEAAYKLFASNGSDMAAMGGQAEGYFLTLGMPFDWTDEDLHSFIEGIQMFLSENPSQLLGGDIVKSPVFFGSVTVFGKPFGKPWLRTGAKEGDNIYVTGTLGCSRLYLHEVLGNAALPLADKAYFRSRHYKPTPRSLWAQEIAKQMPVHAAMDISDGLVEDLTKLCAASGVNFTLDASLIPMAVNHIGKDNFAAHRWDYLKEALIGGEDYELIIISPHSAEGLPLTKVGAITSNKTNAVLFNNIQHPAHEFKGYSHS